MLLRATSPDKPLSYMPSLARLLSWLAVAAVFAWSWHGADIRPLELAKYSGNIVTLAHDFFPPDFNEWRSYVSGMLLTVQIAVWGTGLAIVCAVPLGLLCAGNIAPWWITQPTRRLMDVCRSINELVFAMLFVVAVGLGPFAGVLALWVHTTGILAKLFAEAVEAIDASPVEGIRATGARHIEEIVYGVIPQVMPLWASFSLYRFESNVRSASVIGLVGAGGIGQILWEIIRAFEFQQTCAIMIIIVVGVSLIDAMSQQIRRAFI
ncbi:phosphonate ABC transporter, permease protein PhnE [Paeniroseomonas aquatica]|uniref:Phosphonate ABC transporter, permease protein PhnE n=1 Tax=Paeniroseomonas aquatica TaxID=373043 RepID=A0ABT8AH10_9PROT|nr:phosphonate ABC transporter, permease protein PhnE [Paeniroseomonas aquatica]MDN3568741.1 phosphonate ABC transporter, permease protein PhnE [Paeniroseomonas aquatica]